MGKLLEKEVRHEFQIEKLQDQLTLVTGELFPPGLKFPSFFFPDVQRLSETL